MRVRLLPVPVAAILLLGGLSLPAHAKPPDLPLSPAITCVAEAPSTACPSMGDEAPNSAAPAEPTCPYLKQRQAAQQQPAIKPVADGGPSVLDNLDKLEKAQKLFRRAEFYRRTGHPGMATLYYEKVRTLVPGSSWDEKAGTQLAQLRARKLSGEEPAEATEPSDAPSPQAWEPDEASKIDAHARVTKLLKRCEQAFEGGDYETAEHLLLKAALRMQKLRQQMYTLSPRCDPAEADEPAEATEEEQEEAATATVPEQVAELLEACQRAFTAGCYDEARELARQAMALDPESVACHALVIKLHLLSQLEDEGPGEAATPAPCDDPSAPDPEVSAEPATDESDTPPASSLLPELPPVDPKIVDALEKVLAEAGEPGTPRLTIQVEEAAGDQEEEEEPVSQWPYVAFEGEMPSLYIPPPPQDLTLDEGDASQADDDADDDDCDLSPPRDLNAVLRGALEAIQQGACVEVDVSRPDNLRLRCEFEVAGLQCRILYDYAGHSYIVCALAPEASGDLRAIQLAHNQRVIDWIESMNSLGLSNPNDEDTSDEDDPIDDAPDDDDAL